ncbi:uncharacterized protein CDV56_107957 [Aspergillus thermomutatus]|uniref:Uncharacterized protein n=1 Tax=Aspergillus thermomutatus TaxID=41047 RepID=A0A397HCI2_ASPTH|nr:uncharacterized protein CDV56_107957 [Aspergillus thermomutatus]RHZ58150.1 hypothetical protein CDV56_107957 [Aspergillus thermomutatus]
MSRLWGEVSREAEVYRALQRAQESAVPVFIGTINSAQTYFLHGAGRIRHMLLMGWGGESVGHTLYRKGRVDDRRRQAVAGGRWGGAKGAVYRAQLAVRSFTLSQLRFSSGHGLLSLWVPRPWFLVPPSPSSLDRDPQRTVVRCGSSSTAASPRWVSVRTSWSP